MPGEVGHRTDQIEVHPRSGTALEIPLPACSVTLPGNQPARVGTAAPVLVADHYRIRGPAVRAHPEGHAEVRDRAKVEVRGTAEGEVITGPVQAYCLAHDPCLELGIARRAAVQTLAGLVDQIPLEVQVHGQIIEQGASCGESPRLASESSRRCNRVHPPVVGGLSLQNPRIKDAGVHLRLERRGGLDPEVDVVGQGLCARKPIQGLREGHGHGSFGGPRRAGQDEWKTERVIVHQAP